MSLSATNLQLLAEVGRAGSLAGAARAIGQTPPAVSQAVARIEDIVGVTLVERGARGARLSPLGRLLADAGLEVSTAVERARESACAYLGAHARRLRVGALASTIRPVVADALAHVRLRVPEAELSVVETGSDEGVAQVRAGVLDLAVVATYGTVPRDWADLDVHRLALDPLVVIVPDDHELAATIGRVPLGRLAGEMWAGGSPGSPHRIQHELLLSEAGGPPNVPFETESYEVALALVAAGVGIALVPTSACHDLAGVVALRLQRSPTRVLHAVTRQSNDHLPMLPAMLRALRSTAREGVQAT